MKEKISIRLTDSDKTAYIELDDLRSPKDFCETLVT
jgi:hypothetical protein